MTGCGFHGQPGQSLASHGRILFASIVVSEVL